MRSAPVSKYSSSRVIDPIDHGEHEARRHADFLTGRRVTAQYVLLNETVRRRSASHIIEPCDELLGGGKCAHVFLRRLRNVVSVVPDNGVVCVEGAHGVEVAAIYGGKEALRDVEHFGVERV